MILATFFVFWSQIVQKTYKARLVTDFVSWKSMIPIIILVSILLNEWGIENIAFCSNIKLFKCMRILEAVTAFAF